MQNKTILSGFLILSGLISFLFCSELSNTLLSKEIVLYGNNTTGPYNLADRFILTGSDSIFIRDSLISKDQYKIDYENGTILFQILCRNRPRFSSITRVSLF